MDLSKESLKVREENELFIIGDPGLPNIEETGISLNHPDVRSVFKNPGSKRLLPSGDDSPYAILLLYAKGRRRDVNWMSLQQEASGAFRAVQITASDTPRFRDLIMDMVVFGKRTQCSSCDLFDEYWPDSFSDDNRYILRDWDVRQKPDYSLNRCSSTSSPFLPSEFQYDKPTPGAQNPCKGVCFYFNDVIDFISTLDNSKTIPVPGCSATHPNLPTNRYANIDEQKLADYREHLQSELCNQFPCTQLPSNEAEIAMDTAVNNGEIMELGGTEIPTHLIVENAWNPKWEDQASKYFPDGGFLLRLKEVQAWLRITFPQTEAKPVAFHCGACLHLFKEELADINLQDLMTSEGGYFNREPRALARMIRKHSRSVTHEDALKYSFEIASAKSDKERNTLRKAYQDAYDQTLIPTANMIRTVFAETIAGVGFMYHPIFVDLQEANGVNLGFHHYDGKAARRITDVLAEKMHETLLQHLVQNQEMFSLIVDASTTNKNLPYLICYLQTVEDGYPVTYYYRIVELPDGETAKATFESFWNFVEYDNGYAEGFELLVKNNLRFFVSDNAAVMVGNTKSFLKELSTKLDRDVQNIGCMAHKLALVLKAAIRDKNDAQLQFLHTFEKNLNDFYIFYAARGSKRLQHLSEIALRYGFTIVRFKKNIQVRWAAAEYEVIEAILNNLPAAREDLLEVQISDDFTLEVKRMASKLFEKNTDLTTVLLYHEFIDLLYVNLVLSKTFQAQSGILFDHRSLILASIDQFDRLKKDVGARLRNFLCSCTCKGVDMQCNLVMVESCMAPICGGVALDNNRGVFQPAVYLNQVREHLYDKVIEAFKHYFNLDLILALEAFDNRQFANLGAIDDWFPKFKVVCEFLKFDDRFCLETVNFFYFLIQQLEQIPDYTNNFREAPSKFWPFVLQNIEGKLDLPDNVKTIIKALLILSDSSAVAERGFSFMTRITGDARSSLSSEALDSLLRIKINADKPASQIDAFKYAKEFTKSHYEVDDKAGGRVKKDKEDIYNDRVSRLF